MRRGRSRRPEVSVSRGSSHGRARTRGSPGRWDRGVRHPALGAVAARAEARLRFARPCSRSGTACVRPASGAGSTSPRRSSRRRSAGSTCAPSRTSSSPCCPAQTYVKGFLRTYAEYLGLDGQLYVDEFNSRFVSGEEYEPRVGGRRRATAAPSSAARDERGASRARRDRDLDGDRHLCLEGSERTSPAAPPVRRRRRSSIGRRSSHRSSR